MYRHPHEVINDNLRAAMKYFSLAQPGGEIRDAPGVSLVCSGVPVSVFNSALLSSPEPGEDGDLDRRIAAGSVYFGAKGLPWSFWYCDELLDPATRSKAATIFGRRRLRPLVEPPGMIAARLEPPVRTLPEAEFRRIAGESTRLGFCRVTAVAFDLPLQTSRDIYDSERVWNGGMTGWVGYLRGEPVCTAAVVSAAGVTGVYSVATLPEYRRRGYGEAIVRHALDRAAAETGEERSVLQSTRAGFKLYQRMGYRVVTRFAVYAV